MLRFSCLLLLLLSPLTVVTAADPRDAEVKDVIRRFQQALDRHDESRSWDVHDVRSWPLTSSADWDLSCGLLLFYAFACR